MFSPVCLVLLALALSTLASANLDFENYVRLFNKTYRSPLEMTMRKEVFVKNKLMIERFNAEQAKRDPTGFKLGLSHLTDLTDEEWSVRRGFKVDGKTFRNSPRGEQFFANLVANVSLADLPDELDWSTDPTRVSYVKDQGQCGSCWAFSSTGALEGQMAVSKKAGKLIPLSEQFLLDCSGGANQGCEGGFMWQAWMDVAILDGILDDKSLPYIAALEDCNFNKSSLVFSDSGAYLLKAHDEKTLKIALAKFGPVSVGIMSGLDSFMHYSGGVYNDNSCSGDRSVLDHAVLLVGYGKDAASGLDFWKIKNSWGEQWGEKGYIRIARDANNLCGVTTNPQIPII